jgi:hypothetical protein
MFSNSSGWLLTKHKYPAEIAPGLLVRDFALLDQGDTHSLFGKLKSGKRADDAASDNDNVRA